MRAPGHILVSYGGHLSQFNNIHNNPNKSFAVKCELAGRTPPSLARYTSYHQVLMSATC